MSKLYILFGLCTKLQKKKKTCSKFCIGQYTSKSCNSPWADVPLLYPKIWYTLCWICLILTHLFLTFLCLNWPILYVLFAYSTLVFLFSLSLCTIFPFIYSPKNNVSISSLVLSLSIYSPLLSYFSPFLTLMSKGPRDELNT